MAAPDLDVIKDIPGYKVILKALIKSQIQLLVEQLAAHTDEESIILTASIADGTLSHLGSDSGKLFLEGHEDVKSQFLGFCLKYQHKKKQEKERERLEQELQQKQVLLKQQMRSSTQFSPGGAMPHFMPSRSPRHYSPRYPYGARHEPYRATMQPSRKPLYFNHTAQGPGVNQSATQSDGQVIKIEAEDNENSHQSSSETTAPDTPGAEKGNKAGLPSPTEEPVNKESDDSESESSAIPERLDLEIENLISGVENSVSNTQGSELQTQDLELDPNVSVKFEAVSEHEMDLEITGIELGRPGIPQENWTSNMSMDMNFNPAAVPGSSTDLHGPQQGYTFFGSDARFNCDVCCKSFPTKWELKRHYRTHTGEKPFKCQFCGKRFTVKCNLNSHIMCVHQYVGLSNSFNV